MNMDSLRLIEDLSNANGISGFEDQVSETARKYIGNSMDVKEDSIRNLYIYPKNNKGNRPVVMLDGHSDEVGFMVQSIKSDGTLKFLPIGGWFSQNVGAHKVRVRNADGVYVSGVVASKPPHFMNASDKNTVIEINNMVIDVGATSKDEIVNQFKIELGAPVVPDVTFEFNPVNNVMMGKAFDDRLGCACVIDTLMQLQDAELSVDLAGCLTAQEEVGLRGAQVAARTVNPDVAIVFEGTPSDDGFTDPSIAQGSMGKGPQIRHRDPSMISNPRFVKFAREIAQKENIVFQDAVRESGGTNAGAIHLVNTGIPVIVIGIPVRYAHTHYNYSSYKDYVEAVRWAVAIVKNLDKSIIDSF
jgi:putative aminopeptidase FrvX